MDGMKGNRHKENMGCNEHISAPGVRVVRDGIRGGVSELTCIEQEQMLIILSVKMR